MPPYSRVPSRPTCSGKPSSQALAPALVDASAAVLGLSTRGCHHLSTRVRVDPLRVGANDQMTYVTYLFGFPVGSFRIRTVLSWLLFHGLDVAL